MASCPHCGGTLSLNQALCPRCAYFPRGGSQWGRYDSNLPRPVSLPSRPDIYLDYQKYISLEKAASKDSVAVERALAKAQTLVTNAKWRVSRIPIKDIAPSETSANEYRIAWLEFTNARSYSTGRFEVLWNPSTNQGRLVREKSKDSA